MRQGDPRQVGLEREGDHCGISAATFDKFADRYREKYMDLTLYDDSYRAFCGLLPSRRDVRVLDVACGPGNVSRFIATERPDAQVLGIDLAPRMLELARDAVPTAQFLVHDARRIADLHRRFDGIICAFGLPYLTPDEARAFLQSAADALDPHGVLYVSTMLGDPADSGVERTTSGDEMHVTYYREADVRRLTEAAGFTIREATRIASPPNAGTPTTDLIVIATKA